MSKRFFIVPGLNSLILGLFLMTSDLIKIDFYIPSPARPGPWRFWGGGGWRFLLRRWTVHAGAEVERVAA